MQRFQDEIAGVRLFEGVIRGGGVFGHTRYASNAEGDAKKGEDGLAQVREGFGGVGRIVVEHGNEDVRGAKSFGELYDDSELVDEEVIGGVDDHANKVQLVMARKVLIRVLMLVLTKGAGEGRTESGHPTIQGKELLDGREDNRAGSIRSGKDDASLNQLHAISIDSLEGSQQRELGWRIRRK